MTARVIVWPEGFTEEMKKEFEYEIERSCKRKEMLCVIYDPSCGCQYESCVVLDRFPMSEKIHHRCDDCRKGCMLEISDPIRFHLPMTKQDYSLYDLMDMVVMAGDQHDLIKAYQLEAGLDFLANQCGDVIKDGDT